VDSLAQKRNASILLQQGRALEARELLQEICTTTCRDSEAFYLLANTLLHLGQFSEAVACCERALAFRKDVPAVYFCHAMALGALGQVESAKCSLEAALRIDPKHIESRVRLGAVCFALGQHQDALQHLRLAAKTEPHNVETHIRLADIYLALGKIEQARSAYRKAAKLQPMEPNATAGLAAIAARSNEPRTAYTLIQPFLDQGSDNVSIATLYADISGPIAQREQAIIYLQELLDRYSLPIGEKRRLLFSLGKLNDALANYTAAFEYYRQANELGAESFDPWSSNAQLTSYIDFWSADFLAQAPVARKRNKEQQAIFIVGMPRSGTSLVEQIIGSHPAVYPAGELQELNDLCAQLPTLTKSGKPYPFCIEAVSQAVLDTAAKNYFKTVGKRAGSNKWSVITDKMPNNYWHLGLIQLMFPAAKIIHCVRDPLDTCLSCYFQDFAGQHPYANDLFNLGMYYRQYERLMGHWRNVLHLQVMDVRYEDLVANTEKVSRQLVEYCSLEWNPCVLRYYESKRTVVTSSFDQVTRPIYQKSLARWQQYKEFLEPLRTGLECKI